MPRHARHAPGGVIFHVLNRGAQRQNLFDRDDDYAAFLRVLAEVLRHVPIRLLGYCLMGNHWHLVLWPRRDGELARFMQRLTVTHVRRWVEHRDRVGWGSVYQGRYKSFAVQDDQHLTSVLRYVERNPLRAKLVDDARRWRWSSLGQRAAPADADTPAIPIAPWPTTKRKDWADWVNRPQSAKEEHALQRSIVYGRPYGGEQWTRRMEKRLHLPPLRPRGRPKGTTKRK
jgi:putative transposase